MRYLASLFFLLTLLVVHAAQPTANTPISGMSIANTLQTNAWIPIIQPLPGRTTNDNFRVSPAAFTAYLSTNAAGTNYYNTLIVTNLTVVTNLYMTTNTYIVINGDTNSAGLWINSNNVYYTTQPSSVQVTNLNSQYSLTAANAFLMGPLGASVNLALGTNDLNIDSSRSWYVGATANPADSIIRLNNGWGPGQLVTLQNYGANAFTLRNGDELWNDATKHLYLKGGDWAPTHDGESIMLMGDWRGWAEIGRFGGPTNVLSESLWQVVGGILQPVDLALPVEIDSQIIFGPGTTNVLYRDGSYLHYTNTAGAVNAMGIQLDNGVSKDARLSLQNGVTTLASDQGAIELYEGNGPSTAYWGSAVFAPMIPDNPFGMRTQLGAPYNSSGIYQWGILNLSGSSYHYGWTDGTDYSRLAISHTGTNGAVVLDSQSAGIAGEPVPIALGFNGTNLFQFNRLGQIAFGPGSTNYIQRTNDEILVVSGDPIGYSTFRFANPAHTKEALIGSTPLGALVSATGAGAQIDFGFGSFQATMSSSGLIPGTANLMSLGSPGSEFASLYSGLAVLTPITKAQKTALTPAEGMIVFQSDNTPGLRVYQSGAWRMVSTVADP